MTAREAPRVPFAALIERGMITPGETLFDAKRKVTALVRADGALQLGEQVGSIHRIGALAQGLDACNGWTFWHVETQEGADLDRRIPRRDRAKASRQRPNNPTSRNFASLIWRRTVVRRRILPC